MANISSSLRQVHNKSATRLPAWRLLSVRYFCARNLNDRALELELHIRRRFNQRFGIVLAEVGRMKIVATFLLTFW